MQNITLALEYNPTTVMLDCLIRNAFASVYTHVSVTTCINMQG